MPSRKVSMSELGISFPVLLYVPNFIEEKIINPDLLPGGDLPPGVVIDPIIQAELGTGQMGGGGMGAPGSSGIPGGRTTGRNNPMGGPGQGGMTSGGIGMPLSLYARQRRVTEPVLTVRRFEFVIQFAWKETPPTQRRLNAEDNGAGTTSTASATAVTSTTAASASN